MNWEKSALSPGAGFAVKEVDTRDDDGRKTRGETIIESPLTEAEADIIVNLAAKVDQKTEPEVQLPDHKKVIAELSAKLDRRLELLNEIHRLIERDMKAVLHKEN